MTISFGVAALAGDGNAADAASAGADAFDPELEHADNRRAPAAKVAPQSSFECGNIPGRVADSHILNNAGNRDHNVHLSQTIDPQQLHQLLVFVAIVEAGSLTAAARRLRTSKGSVSTHLSTLERNLGVRLLHRTTRRIALTQVGAEVLEAARRIRTSAADVAELAAAETTTVRGVLRIASAVDLGTVVLRPVIRSLRLRHPELSIDVRIEDRPIDLAAEGIDVALRVGVPEDSSYVIQVLDHDREIIVAAPGLAETLGAIRSPSDLVDAPWIRHNVVDADEIPYLEEGTDKVERLTGISAAVTVSSSQLMRQLACDGVGVCAVPSIFVRNELRAGRLVRVAAGWRRRMTQVFALRPFRSAARRVGVFLEATRATLAALSEHAPGD